MDLGLAIGAPTREGLRSVPLGSTPGVVVCGKTHPLFGARRLTPAMLAQHPFVVPGFLGEEGAVPIDQFPSSIPRRVGATIELLQMGIALAAEGAWLGYFPAISVEPLVRRGELRAFPIAGALPFTLRATFRPADEDRRAMRATLDALESTLRSRARGTKA